MVVTALSAAAAMLLVVAGIAKLRTPAPAAGMIVGFWPGLRPFARARRIARAAGLVELASGVAVLAGGGRVAAVLLVACYLALTVVALRLTGSHAACGCFGAADGEVGAAHVVLDVCGLAIAVAAVVHPSSGVVALLDPGALRGVTVLVQSALLAGLGYLSITALPALAAARRSVEAAR